MSETSLGIRTHELDAAEAVAWSSGALARPMIAPAELSVFTVRDEAILLGAFQRSSELSPPIRDSVFRRASGGPALRVAPGTLWMQLSLTRPDVLVPCEVSRVLNRYVRPLLKAVTRVAALANYFDRDWIAVKHRPVAFVGFAHEAASRRTLVEALISVRAQAFVGEHASLRGKTPWTLEEAAGKRVEDTRLSEAVVASYLEAYSCSRTPLSGSVEPASSASDEPAWTASREEAMGRVYAGRDHDGRMRVGGEFMASRDAVDALETGLASLDSASRDDVGRAVDETLGAAGTALFGVRSLVSVRDAILDAWNG
ncbi:hypothetical protein AKJ09_03757 [Labilithrix luteola]|uniref:Lipoate-protein ligase A n=1 Tax=Labilithrix luteola TaxID=1391654 RepID=A0A0K1PU77_9BACT|nr:hypothetical protein [Labilithrix luteola]AKU97093.1 hypothetical protein AKJ09_03757 [Labilithrix luteola]